MKNAFEITLAILFIFSFLADKITALFIASNRLPWLDAFFAFVANYMPSAGFIAGMLVYIAIKKRDYIKPYIAALISSAIATVLLKIFVDRARPFIALGIEKLPNISYDFASWNQSFPSWHSVSLFLIIPFIGKKYRVAWFVIAAMIGLSRMYSNVHYLSDVLFGALLGYSLSKICIAYFKK